MAVTWHVPQILSRRDKQAAFKARENLPLRAESYTIASPPPADDHSKVVDRESFGWSLREKS